MELSEAARQARNEYNREYNRKKSDAAREAQRQYVREWKRKNAEKVRQYNIDFWERKAMEANDEPIEVKVLKLHRQGFSLREIAAKVGINHMKVSRILKSI